jgi:hypothetical protein
MHNTEAPLYPVATRGFIDWLARDFETKQAAAHAALADCRARISSMPGLHPRTVPALAKLYVALKFATDNAHDEGALTDSEVKEMLAEAWTAFTTGGIEEQAATQHETNEVERYYELNTGCPQPRTCTLSPYQIQPRYDQPRAAAV